MEKYLLVAGGGVIGAVLRYALSDLLSGGVTTGKFPHWTLVVNIVGCFVMGAFMALGYEKLSWSADLRLFFAVGVLGAFTTFSTFSFETVSLFRDGLMSTALLNVLVSVLGCLGATALGILLVKQF